MKRGAGGSDVLRRSVLMKMGRAMLLAGMVVSMSARAALAASPAPVTPAAGTARADQLAFRELYREELSQTLPDGADLDAELRHLAEALARC